MNEIPPIWSNDPEERAVEEQIVNDVQRFGWHGLAIGPHNGSPGFEYTIGLMATHAHPEIIIFGLRPDLRHALVSALVKEIAGGRRFKDGDAALERLKPASCMMRRVDPSQHAEYMGFAMWHRRFLGQAGTLEALQCFWADRDGRYPWAPGCSPEFLRVQPLLYQERSRSS